MSGKDFQVKSNYSSFSIIFFCILVSFISVISDIYENFLLITFTGLFLFMRFRKLLDNHVKKYILFSGMIFTIPIYFIFPSDLVFEGFSLSLRGFEIYILLCLRLTVFYLVFETIVNSISPVELFNDFSKAGFDDIALLSSVTLNQLNNIGLIIQEVFTNYRLRFSGFEIIRNFSYFLISVMRVSIKKADDLAFALYCTENIRNKRERKISLFRFNDLELIAVPVIMICIKLSPMII